MASGRGPDLAEGGTLETCPVVTSGLGSLAIPPQHRSGLLRRDERSPIAINGVNSIEKQLQLIWASLTVSVLIDRRPEVFGFSHLQ